VSGLFNVVNSENKLADIMTKGLSNTCFEIIECG
jgi:hypothetical protein